MRWNRQSLALAILFIAVSMIAFPVPARAADFTFNIPVELNNLNPTFYCARIACGVYGEVSGKIEMIGSGSKDLFDYQLVGGNFNNTVTIGFNAMTGKDPAAAKEYNCSLLLGVRERPSFVQTNELDRFLRVDGPYPRDPSKPFVVTVAGKIPAPKPNKKTIMKPGVKPYMNPAIQPKESRP